MKRHKRKRRRLRRWAKGALLCFACFVLYQGGSFLHGSLKESSVKEEPQMIKYPETVGSKNQIVYYNQEDPRWGEKTYGPVDKISDTGCGPTVLAMAVSSLTEKKIDPEEMCRWAYLKGYCSIGFGSFHTLINGGLDFFGIANTVTNDRAAVKAALQNGTPVIALMGEGHFTSGGHFILLCEIDEDGMVIVADPKSVERTKRKWNFSIIAEEAKRSPAVGGAYWILRG